MTGLLWLALGGATVSPLRGQDRPAADRPARALSPTAEQIRAQLAKENSSVTKWYARHGHEPVWDAAHLRGLATFLQGLDRHGLQPGLFGLDRWIAAWNAPAASSAEAARTDIATTHLALYAIQALAYGFVDPGTVHPKWEPIARSVSPQDLLGEALRQGPGNFAAWLEKAAAPPDPRYWEMVETLERYRRIAQLGGWKALPSPPSPVGLNGPYRDIPLLRARLQAEGDLPADGARLRTKTIDASTWEGLKSFQFRHGIEPDGVMGPQTLAEMNKPAEDRVNTLIVNLDRLRWMPRAYEQAEHVEVNIGESALRLFRGGRPVKTIRVIVGQKGKHQTPVFHGKIQYLIFRPYWNVPLSIAKNEVVPEALKDPSYVSRENYEIVPGFGVAPSRALPATADNLQKVAAGQLSIRQGTGPHNALGLVKFIFPNDNSVYLHDTPDHSLFQRADRDFSHGCVRVSEPALLAEYALAANGDWSPGQIEAAMNDASRPDRRVNLKKSIPVYLIYWTSTAMNDGRIRFDQDIYGHDEVMRDRLGLGVRAVARPE